MAKENLAETYILIHAFLSSREHTKAAKAVKKAAKESKVANIKSGIAPSINTSLETVVSEWKELSARVKELEMSIEQLNGEIRGLKAGQTTGKRPRSPSNSSSSSEDSDESSSSTSSSEENETSAPKPLPNGRPKLGTGKDSELQVKSTLEVDESSSTSDSEDETKIADVLLAPITPQTEIAQPKLTTGNSSSSVTNGASKFVKAHAGAPAFEGVESAKVVKRQRTESGVKTTQAETTTMKKVSSQIESSNTGKQRGGIPFQRVKVQKVEFADTRLKDNTFAARGGAIDDYGAKAAADLGVTRGSGFRKEKNKKKRGSYRGGEITLLLPFKRTSQPPIADAVRQYISKYHPDTLPDAFTWDVAHWESLRREVSGQTVHSSTVDAFLKYHAQLILMLTKLPVDIGLPIAYYHAFQPPQPPLSLSNLAYERVCLLFNLAALFCHLAEAQNRDTTEGIKRASANYQNAAGTLAYLLENALPPFVSSLAHPTSSNDLSKPVIKALEYLMLAQAAECYWQKAVMDSLRNSTIARLSQQVASYYGLAYSTIQASPALVASALPSNWMAQFQTKQHHFEAAAQIRKSMDDSENNKFGSELARLASALVCARQGLDSARRGVKDVVREDIEALFKWIEEQTAKAQRDNDYIYHQEVPPISALEIIEPANLVNSAVLGGLKDPQTALNGDEALFSDLMSWGSRMALEIYAERKITVINNMRQLQQDHDRIASAKLQECNLPAALEILDRPLALPATVLSKAEEVRADDGPLRIHQLLEDVEALAAQDRSLLVEIYDILDAEAEDDEMYRKRFGPKWSNEPSQLANEDLVAKAKHFNSVLERAHDTDRTVKEKWMDWMPGIETLASDEASLQRLPMTSPASKSPSSPLSTQTKSHVRILRGHLESLDELRRNRQHSLIRAQNLSSGDDISDRIKLVAVGFERWTQVKAEMFEDVMEEELQKYDKFKSEITATANEQKELLKKIEERNAALLQSRHEDPINKNLEKLVKNLNAAYTKYKEIVQNCGEGLKFYNDFAQHLKDLRDACKDWAYARKQKMNAMVEELELINLNTPPNQSPITPSDDIAPTLSPPGSSPETTTSSPPASPSDSRSSNKREKLTPRSNSTAIIADIPHPNSSQWEPLVPVPPTSSPLVRGGPSTRSKRQSRDEASSPVGQQHSPQSASINTSAKGSKPKRQVY
ncbi:pH-response regulator protein palA/rim20 [Serendipita sp. 399]|nr:pH-response regulator protein palA/rim20 [Serendipita sp. 399]